MQMGRESLPLVRRGVTRYVWVTRNVDDLHIMIVQGQESEALGPIPMSRVGRVLSFARMIATTGELALLIDPYVMG